MLMTVLRRIFSCHDANLCHNIGFDMLKVVLRRIFSCHDANLCHNIPSFGE